MDQDFALDTFIAAALHHGVKDRSENQTGGDTPVAYSDEQHSDAEQQTADGQHAKLFDPGGKQHHGNTADQRGDHTDKQGENKGRTSKRRGKNHNRVGRRRNTDVDQVSPSKPVH